MLAAANAVSTGNNNNTVEDEVKQFQKELNEQYNKQLIELAKRNLYSIQIYNIKESKWERKRYRRHKITTEDFGKAKLIITDYEDMIQQEEEGEGGEGEGEGEGESIETQLKRLDKVMEYYEFLAMCYLRMSSDEFKRADYGAVRMIVDACQHRTSRSPANFSNGLYEFFHLDLTSHLVDSDYEMLKMYRLWTGKANTKPWEYNGGFVYEEDLNTILKIEELQISGDNYKAKKQQARESHGQGGSLGEDGVLHRKTVRYKNR